MPRTPLLLLSGIGIGYEVFDRLIDALDPDIDIIRVDVPGVGGSPVALLPAGFPQLAGLLAALLDDLGYRQVDVLGFSWGGALAQQFAVQYPSRCRRLILMSTSTGLHVGARRAAGSGENADAAGLSRPPAGRRSDVRRRSRTLISTMSGSCSGTAR